MTDDTRFRIGWVLFWGTVCTLSVLSCFFSGPNHQFGFLAIPSFVFALVGLAE